MQQKNIYITKQTTKQNKTKTKAENKTKKGMYGKF